ncbi:MAG: hypothetical protein QM535_20270, partial [Limnohabitans sp.]|nr:hypothetical protein [Limnohabitans sp.]
YHLLGIIMFIITDSHFILICSLLILSCSIKGNNKIITFAFDSQTFTLPNKVRNLQTQHNIKYFVYRGFRGYTENYNILLNLDKYPIWIGSENVNEITYQNDNVIGITFIGSTTKIDLKSKKNQLEIIYKAKFVSLKGSVYQKLETKEGITIVAYTKKNNAYFSFFIGLKDNDVLEYVKNSW